MWNWRFRSSNGHFNYEIRDRISSTFEGLATVFNRFMKSLAIHSVTDASAAVLILRLRCTVVHYAFSLSPQLLTIPPKVSTL